MGSTETDRVHVLRRGLSHLSHHGLERGLSGRIGLQARPFADADEDHAVHLRQVCLFVVAAFPGDDDYHIQGRVDQDGLAMPPRGEVMRPRLVHPEPALVVAVTGLHR